jgi:hypothetical protein
MKTFKHLKIESTDSQTLKDILSSIISGLPSNWKLRSDLVNDYAKNVSKSKDEIGCFESPIIGNQQGFVWFVIWEEELSIVNIVPTVSGELTFDEYNNILDAFYIDCVSRPLTGKSVAVKISVGIYDIEALAGKNTFDALNKWENLCNHSTGNSHPNDFEHWADFVSIAFNEKSELTPDLLSRWLVEERNWKDEDLVSELMVDYEYGLALLERYAQNHQS